MCAAAAAVVAVAAAAAAAAAAAVVAAAVVAVAAAAAGNFGASRIGSSGLDAAGRSSHMGAMKLTTAGTGEQLAQSCLYLKWEKFMARVRLG